VANPRRYLLPSERLAVEVRRHWAVLVADTLQSALLFTLGLLLTQVAADNQFLRTFSVYFCLFVVFRWVWIFGDWWVEKLVITDKRVLLVTGIVTRKVAIMPLVKVTDLTYNRSTTGLMLGYGEFVVETAGQDQALSRINFIPKPERLYMQISELLFGGDKGAPGALPSPAELEAELEAGRRAIRRRSTISGWRRRRAGTSAPIAEEEPASGRLDDLLARRDTLLADRYEYGDEVGRYGEDQPRRYESRRGPPPDGPTEEYPIIHEPRREGGRLEPPVRRDRGGPAPPRPFEPPHAPPVDPSDD
jgi:Bacterial PH domain